MHRTKKKKQFEHETSSFRPVATVVLNIQEYYTSTVYKVCVFAREILL